jgi:hypothetical protein
MAVAPRFDRARVRRRILLRRDSLSLRIQLRSSSLSGACPVPKPSAAQPIPRAGGGGIQAPPVRSCSGRIHNTPRF